MTTLVITQVSMVTLYPKFRKDTRKMKSPTASSPTLNEAPYISDILSSCIN